MKDVNILTNNGVDIKASLEFLGDMSMYDDTLNEFLNGINTKLDDIKKYKEASDMPNYAIQVHSLKSDAKYLGFSKLADLAFQHEMESKNNNVEFVNSNYDSLIAEANRVLSVVKQYTGDSQAATQAVQPTSTSNKTILVADDSDIIRNFVNKTFSQDYQVLYAKDGQETINAMQSNQNIVALLLDLNMPKVDGFQVLDFMNQSGLFNKIPVSIITGDDSKDTIDKAFTYPITDVLQKPFNEMNIKAVVDKMLAINQN